jgi:hypothetical protein
MKLNLLHTSAIAAVLLTLPALAHAQDSSINDSFNDNSTDNYATDSGNDNSSDVADSGNDSSFNDTNNDNSNDVADSGNDNSTTDSNDDNSIDVADSGNDNSQSWVDSANDNSSDIAMSDSGNDNSVAGSTVFGANAVVATAALSSYTTGITVTYDQAAESGGAQPDNSLSNSGSAFQNFAGMQALNQNTGIGASQNANVSVAVSTRDVTF